MEEEFREVASKIASALREMGGKIQEEHLPKLTKNITALAVVGMSVYTLGVALGSMMPTAVPVFAQMGVILGYVAPLMFLSMLLSLTVFLAKTLMR